MLESPRWNRQEQGVPSSKNGATLLNPAAHFLWSATHALLSKYYSLLHRWKVPWATPSSLAAALPDSSPLRHAAMTAS